MRKRWRREGRKWRWGGGGGGRSLWALFSKTHIIFHLGLIEQRNLSIIPVMQLSWSSLDLRVGESPETSLHEVIIQGVVHPRITGKFLWGWEGDLVSYLALWVSWSSVTKSYGSWTCGHGYKVLNFGSRVDVHGSENFNSTPADHIGIPLHRPQEATEEVVFVFGLWNEFFLSGSGFIVLAKGERIDAYR